MNWKGWVIVFLAHSLLSSCEYTLVWNDEFNGPRLDTTKWDYEINCWGGGNNEKQCYIASDSTLSIQNGILVFHPVFHPNGYRGSKDNCTNNNDDSCTWVQPVTSARIRSLKSGASWLRGRFEFRARLPLGNFLWPAIWMIPTDDVYGTWAASGEIDIVEFRGQPSESRVLEQTVHHGGQWPDNTYTGSGKIYFDVDFTNAFHIFVFEWTDEKLMWFVDDEKTYELSLNRSWWSGRGTNPYTGPYQPFDQRFHLILNLAIAGNFFPEREYGPFDPPTDSQTWSKYFQIDYVRVYQDVDGSQRSLGINIDWWVLLLVCVLALVILVQAMVIWTNYQYHYYKTL